jgi:hypothetical protein
VNGAPANPISGVSPSSGRSSRTASATKPTASGSSGWIAATSSSVATGMATTGPVPGTMSRSTPAAATGTTMSLNRIAASTPWRRTG